jgi:hypothetical protein
LEEAAIESGAETLANLIAPYSEKTQSIILAMIKEGNEEEVTEQFYELIESLKSVENDYEDDDDDEDDDDEDDDDEDDDETDESFLEDGENSYINEEETGEEEELKKKKINSILSEIAGISNV